ncbi:MAG: rhamnogalacturonan lyase, partial [Polyangiaceae bacterium]
MGTYRTAVLALGVALALTGAACGSGDSSPDQGGATPDASGSSSSSSSGAATSSSSGSGGGAGSSSSSGAAPSSSSSSSGVSSSSGGSSGSSSGTVTSPPPPTCGGAGQAACPTGQYQMENLDRGVVAVQVTGGVYVGWRMLGYEYTGTDSDTSYNLYKDGTKLASVTNSTNYLDPAGTATSQYTVTCVLKGVEGTQSPAVTVWAQNYLSIPLTPPTDPSTLGATYSASDGATGDLNGDGILDLVLKWDPSNSHDNAQSGDTSDVFIDGYSFPDGKRLWRLDLGPNIRAGAHYTQMSLYDFDGDGIAELGVKTAPGTKDGTGAYLSKGSAAGADNTQVYRNSSGYILTGPEWFTMFSGQTGAELGTIDYPVPRGDVSAWGDAYGNRVDRFNGGFS